MADWIGVITVWCFLKVMLILVAPMTRELIGDWKLSSRCAWPTFIHGSSRDPDRPSSQFSFFRIRIRICTSGNTQTFIQGFSRDPDRPSTVLILIPTSGNTQPRWVPCSRIKQREAKLIHPSKNPPHDFSLQKFLHIHIFLGNSPNAIWNLEFRNPTWIYPARAPLTPLWKFLEPTPPPASL